MYRWSVLLVGICVCFLGVTPSLGGEEITSLAVELETPAVVAGQALSLAAAEHSFEIQAKALLEKVPLIIEDIIPLPYLGMAIVRTSEDGAKALKALEETPGVHNATLGGERKLFGETSAQPRYIPQDPFYGKQWHLPAIHCPAAWDATRGDSSMVVAVVDTGVAYNHPDLQGSMWTNPNEIPNDGIDNDGNGFVDDYYGVAFYRNGKTPISTGNPNDVVEPGEGHGTHVAGTIAAGINGIGVVGVAPDVKIMGVRCFSQITKDDGSPGSTAFTVDIIRGIEYILAMKNRGVDVRAACFSLGGDPGDPPIEIEENAFVKLSQGGIIPFIAAGNDSNNNDRLPVYPPNYDIPLGVAVGASDQNNLMAEFSNYGASTVDIFAPGVRIGATVPDFVSDSGYVYMDGTSMATPVALGVAMLIWGENPSLSPQEVRRILLASGTPSQGLRGRCATGYVVDAARRVVPTPSSGGGGGGGGCILGFAPLGMVLLLLPLGFLRWR